jgi:hypothetical protein
MGCFGRRGSASWLTSATARASSRWLEIRWPYPPSPPPNYVDDNDVRDAEPVPVLAERPHGRGEHDGRAGTPFPRCLRYRAPQEAIRSIAE